MKLVGLTLLVGTWAWVHATIPVAAAGDEFHLDGKLDEAF